MTVTSARKAAGTLLSRLESDALTCVYHHRIISTGQLKTLLQPDAASTRYTYGALAGLRAKGLVACRTHKRAHEKLWFVTGAGAGRVEDGGELTARGWRLDPQEASEYDPRHTLAVVDTACAFAGWARRLGHECSAWDLTPEVAHRIGGAATSRSPGDHLIADGLLHYVAVLPGEQRVNLQALIEVDRSTMTVARLAAKFSRYARYYDYSSAGHGGSRDWQRRYPQFPAVLVVLAGTSAAAADRRAMDLRALALADRRFQRLAGVVDAGVTTLHRLSADGPFAPVLLPLLGPADRPTDMSFGRLAPSAVATPSSPTPRRSTR